MRRAWFFAFVGLLAFVGGPTTAREHGKVVRLGYLANSEAETDYFRNAMKSLNYVEGRNLLMEWRFSKGWLEQLPALASELVGLKPDCIVAIGVIRPAPSSAQRTSSPLSSLSGLDPVIIDLIHTC
jgi:hypothetical protein